MAKVAVTYRILPEDVETDLGELEERIRSLGYEIYKVEREPIAFGLTALKVVFFLEDEEGGIEKLEEALRGLAGVSEIECTGVTRVGF